MTSGDACPTSFFKISAGSILQIEPQRFALARRTGSKTKPCIFPKRCKLQNVTVQATSLNRHNKAPVGAVY